MSTSAAALELAVVIYKPQKGNFYHWGLHVRNRISNAHHVFQVEGPQHELEPMRRDVKPYSSSRLLQTVVIGHLRDSDFSVMEQAIRAIEVQNDIPTWDCQEYVIDIMDSLEQRGLLGGMRKYSAVKKAIKNMRGDMDSTHLAVVNYDYARLHEDDDEDDDDDEESEETDDDDGLDDDEDDENDVQPRQFRSADKVQDSSDDE
ncbi:hypothetical protein M409DRAFT_22743 [Zasmidium cellare ATCC 36951]|uniref:Uncharacterized protein n=1 Tax=Zasmidium cellare ATCC 36951 TaxID=1080233 RepID=A0A6A6CPC9_ZASCE|nr:uncharacterized protein M409DRAFT_22743 [Zasmidium cellare ATCC 36951]KAF2167316.1 hypothetical protein M409DRAFT_22743 [Zasmidium cellare ATCC 36951]